MRDSEPAAPDERADRLDACLAISALCIDLALAGAGEAEARARERGGTGTDGSGTDGDPQGAQRGTKRG